jgi:hypothetical protein
VYIGNDASNENPTQIFRTISNQFDFEYQYYDTNLGSHIVNTTMGTLYGSCQRRRLVNDLGDDDTIDSIAWHFYENKDLVKVRIAK